ncbi:MAG: MFS transporter, partial [Acidobacteriota bacterium]
MDSPSEIRNVPAKHDPYAALRVKGFRWFMVSLWTMTLSSQIQGLVVAWQVYSYTHEPLSLGLVGLAEALPFISAALFAGHVADRFSRKRIAVLSLAVLVICSATFLIFTFSGDVVGPGRVWPIYLVIFVSGIARSFAKPASTALSADLVPRQLYATAVAWRTSSWQSAAVIGPAAGGILYGFGSARLAYAADTALMLIALMAFAMIAHVHVPDRSRTLPIRESLAVGLRFVWSQPIILGALTLDLFSVLFGGAVALLPVFASDILHVGPQGLGMLRAAPAIGSVLMGLILAHRRPLEQAGTALFGCVALFGLSMIAFGLSRSFVLSVVLLAFSGMVDNVSIVVRSTLLQTMTPADMFGRV